MNDEQNNNSWLNIADMMSALMMIFMFIAVLFMYQLENEKEIYRVKLNKALNKEFKDDLKKWNAIITEDNIVRFKAPFKIGKSDIPKSFKKILDDFFPRYIKVLSSHKFKEEIAEIRVEGHTSNGWGDEKSSIKIYLNNMNLSQKRASKVLAYAYSLNNPIVNKNRAWLEKYLRANGMAFSNCLYYDKKKTKIDPKSSRRVEFKVLTKEHYK